MKSVERDLLQRAAGLTVWSRGDWRAPHKPLLLLLAARRAELGLPPVAEWSWWRDQLKPLLTEYAPTGAKAKPSNPFQYLVSDGLWHHPTSPHPASAYAGGLIGNPMKKSWLDQHNPEAGLPDAFHACLTESADARDRLVRLLLHKHFPPTIWRDVVVDAGVSHDLAMLVALPSSLTSRAPTSTRAASFATDVLDLDSGRCVGCGFDGRDTGITPPRPVGVEAAHVRWHNLAGPDIAENGVTLCATHHRLFDRGMWGWEPETRLLVVSPRYAASPAVDLLRRGTRLPARVDDAYVEWQHENVFRH